MSWAGIVFTFALVDNVVLSRLLGLPANEASASSHSEGAEGSAASTVQTPSIWWLGISITVLMTASAVCGWALNALVLVPMGFTLLRTPVMVFLVAGLALGFQGMARRIVPGVLEESGVSLARIGVNCVVLGLVLVTTRSEYGLLQSLFAGVGAGAGYLLATALMDAIRDRLEIEPVPASVRGLPLQLITAGLMAYAFMAFDRAFLARLLGA